MATLAWQVSGCFDAAHDCERNPILRCGSWAVLTGGGGGSTSTGTSTGGNGGGGGTPGCVPSENVDPVGEDCGVFVSSSLGKAGNDGLKGSPFATIQAALDAKKGTKIYVCAEEMTGSVTLSSGVTMYGGLDCHKGWVYVGGKTKSVLKGEADKPALVIGKEADGAAVVDFAIQGADAVAPGGSSIAAVVDQAAASLFRCDLVAGNGMVGELGANAPEVAAQMGTNGNNGGDACSSDTVNGAAQVKNACGVSNSIGGQGGTGNDVNGGDGAKGLPNNGGGLAGQGDDGTAGWTCSSNGGTGQAGFSGTPGQEGPGALLSEIGALSSGGFVSAPGHDGDPGLPGQGGGGGGGVKGDGTMGKTLCKMNPGIGGASGGSGGAGGCGGEGGKGGKGGGASIALVSLDAKLVLTDVTLKASNGGKGGAGGNSQAGGAPGAGGIGGSNAGAVGLKTGCDGGKGGPGGDGGPGGGGRGGHSIGLAYVGTAPAIDTKSITLGTSGMGGPGGNENLKGNAGASGVATATQEFK
jgi:hypothetical protein